VAFNNFGTQQPFTQIGGIQASDGTSVVNFCTQYSNWREIDSIIVTSNDTVDRVLTLGLNDATHGYQQICSVTIPAGSGHGGLPPVDVYAAGFPANFPPIQLDSLWQLQAALEVGLTAAKSMLLIARGSYI
jgi:hypothetical protein